MNRRIVASLMFTSLTAFSLAGNPEQGVVRIKIQPEFVEQLKNNKEIKGLKVCKAFPCSPEREAEHAKFGLDLWYEVFFDESVSPIEARNILSRTAGVMDVSLKKAARLFDEEVVIEGKAETRASYTGNLPFNDPHLNKQWNYNNDGSQNGSVPGADINLFKAWEISTGSPNVVVAIVDGGIDTKHEDLIANLWCNEAELNGTPGIDDDGNGYIDDVYGYNFCSKSDGTINPHTHGTHVAGIVGAVNNNGIGVCGIAGGDGTPGSGVRLMSCQVFDTSDKGDGDFARALVYAADMGATVAQCSWAWPNPNEYDPAVLEAIRYFVRSARADNMAGGICVCGTGNNGMNGRFYPACMDEVISVAAMTHSLEAAYYSNRGFWVDVTAPGGDRRAAIYSTTPGNSYGNLAGTSQATPHVSGIAALVLSKYGTQNLSAESVKRHIIESVNDLYSNNPDVRGLFGSGYVDAAKALQWEEIESIENVEISGFQEGPVFVEIFTTSGLLVYSRHYNGFQPGAIDSDTNSLPQGYFVMRITSGDKQQCKTIAIRK